MILTTHALVGAAIGKHIGNPWIVAVVAVPIHFFLDHFRHGEYLNRERMIKNNGWKIVLDVSCGFAIIALYLLFMHPAIAVTRNILIGTFFSMFPDLLTLLYWKFNLLFLKSICKFHAWCHKYPPLSKERKWNLRNARNDMLFSAIAIILLLL